MQKILLCIKRLKSLIKIFFRIALSEEIICSIKIL